MAQVENNNKHRRECAPIQVWEPQSDCNQHITTTIQHIQDCIDLFESPQVFDVHVEALKRAWLALDVLDDSWGQHVANEMNHFMENVKTVGDATIDSIWIDLKASLLAFMEELIEERHEWGLS